MGPLRQQLPTVLSWALRLLVRVYVPLVQKKPKKLKPIPIKNASRNLIPNASLAMAGRVSLGSVGRPKQIAPGDQAFPPRDPLGPPGNRPNGVPPTQVRPTSVPLGKPGGVLLAETTLGGKPLAARVEGELPVFTPLVRP